MIQHFHKVEQHNNLLSQMFYLNICVKTIVLFCFFCLQFDGEAGSEFREGCAIFCRNQSYALEQLRIKQRRDEKFSRLLAVSITF